MNMYLTLLMYFLVLVFLGVAVYIGKKLNIHLWQKILIYVIGAMPLLFIMAFRYDVGTDYFFTYIPNFQTIASGGSAYPNERGFYLINKLLSIISSNAQIIIIFTSAVYVLLLLLILIEISDNVIISIIVLFLMSFFFIALNNVRQQIACMMVVWGYKFIRDRNLAAYICVIIVATYFFHQTALFLIIVYPLFNMKLIQKTAVVTFPLAIVLLPLVGKLFMLVLNLLGYEYGDSNEFETKEGNSLLLFINATMLLVYTLIFNKKLFKNRILFGFWSLQFIAFYISGLTFFLKIAEIPDRVAYYSMLYQIISLPLLLKEARSYGKFIMPVTGLLVLTIMIYTFTKLIIINNYHETYPYQFVFSHLESLKVIKPNALNLINVLPNYVNFSIFRR